MCRERLSPQTARRLLVYRRYECNGMVQFRLVPLKDNLRRIEAMQKSRSIGSGNCLIRVTWKDLTHNEKLRLDVPKGTVLYHTALYCTLGTVPFIALHTV